MALLHISAYSDHLQGGCYQRKKYLWLILLEMSIYKAKMHVLNKLHDEMLVALNRLHIFVCIAILFVVKNAHKHLRQKYPCWCSGFVRVQK
jgi:hypothetical protein